MDRFDIPRVETPSPEGHGVRLAGGPGKNDGTATSGETNEDDQIDTNVETLVGGSGNDTLTSNNNDDTLGGGAGDDDLDGNGNTGVWADFSDSAAAVTVDLDAGTATRDGTDTLTDITNVSVRTSTTR